MCTAITIKASDHSVLMARTMDFSYPLNPGQYSVPSGFRYCSDTGGECFRTKYAFEGTGQPASSKKDAFLFADGVNETGLCAAALYFPGFAQYDNETDAVPAESSARNTVAAYEVVPFLLATCADAAQAVAAVRTLRIVGMPDAVTGIAAPLHWLIADRSGACVTVEKTAAGLRCYANPVGVLTNSPGFGWQMLNLRNYLNLVPEPSHAVSWGDATLSPFGQGSGSFGLSGDFTPPGRFVRAAWLKTHADACADFSQAKKLAKCVLGNVSIPKGCVITEHGTIDYTQYTVYFNLSESTCLLDTGE